MNHTQISVRIRKAASVVSCALVAAVAMTGGTVGAQTELDGIGNPAIHQHTLFGVIGADNPAVGMTFEIPGNAASIAKAYFETKEPTGGAFRVTVGFQSAFEVEHGRLSPSGSWVDGVTAEIEISDAGVHEVEFSPPVRLEAMTPYFLMISTGESSPSGSLAVLLGNSQRAIENKDEEARGPFPLYRPDDSTDGSYGIYSQEQTDDWSRQVNWTPYVPIFLLVDPAGNAFGSPFQPNRSLAIRGNQNVIVQEFAVPSEGSPREVSELTVIGRMTASAGTALDLDVAVEDAATGEIVGSTVLHFSEPTLERHIAGEFYTATFDTPVVLEPGKTYRLEIRAQRDMQAHNCFFMARGIAETWVEKAPESTQLQNLATGRGAQVSRDDGINFTAPEGAWANMLFFFR